MLRLFKNLLLIGITMFASSAANAQDLIAKRAPSDNKLIDVKNVKLNNFFSAKENLYVENDIYTSWTHNSVANVEGYLPANFKVDLRGFCMPTPSRKITSRFGPRWGRQHQGLDIKVYIGDTIVSAFNGKVRIVGYDANGWGYYVCIRHSNGLETLYGHLSRQLVKENDVVKAGQPIGLGGNTGRSTGSHLHFETRLLGKAINPEFMFDFPKQDVTGDYYISRLGEINRNSSASSRSNKSSK